MNQQHILLVAVLGLAFSPLIARGADASQSALAAEPDDSGGNSQPSKEKWIKSLTNQKGQSVHICINYLTWHW